MAQSKKRSAGSSRTKAAALIETPVAGGRVFGESGELEGRDEEIRPEDLLLDPGNFRLFEQLGDQFQKAKARLIGEPSIQNRLLRELRETRFDIGSLRDSISYNGFLRHERLIVVPYDGTRFIVLEGNRRLATVKGMLSIDSKSALSARVRDSLVTLPCFVLNGPPVKHDDEQLALYRRQASLYVGLRHLMGPKEWQPTGRYAFLAHLVLQDNWSIAEVEQRFGRSRHRILNDIRGHILYRDFLSFVKGKNLDENPVTYNAFAEIAKSPDLSSWLGWDTDARSYLDENRKYQLFAHLLGKLTEASFSSFDTDDQDEEARQHVIAEDLIRHMRDMVKLGDPEINDLLEEGDFKSADALYERRKQGPVQRRIRDAIQRLEAIQPSELRAAMGSHSASDVSHLLTQLIEIASSLLDFSRANVKKSARTSVKKRK